MKAVNTTPKNTQNTQVFSLKPLANIRNKMIDLFVEREEAVTGVLAGLLTGYPTFLLGEPGTAKTMMIDSLSRMLNAKYFYYLLTRFTEPDEIVGTIDINALRQGRYVRITRNKLPEAEIVFLDEIFKASSSIRNILLDIILNKRFYDGEKYIKVDNVAMYTASNEISNDEEDWAFYDRLVIRINVKPVGMDSWEELIVRGLSFDLNSIDVIADVSYIRSLQRLVVKRAKAVVNNRSLINKYIEALAELENAGIHISDRKKIQTIYVASAISVIYLEQSISLDDVADALRFTAWSEPDQIPKIEEIISSLGLSQYNEQLQRVATMFEELNNLLKMTKEAKSINEFRETFKALVTVYKNIVLELKRLPKTPRIAGMVRKYKKQLLDAKAFIEEFKKQLMDI